MRILSDLEKDLCRCILHGKDGYNVIPNIIDDKLHEILIVVDKENKKVEIEFPIRNIQPTDIDTQAIIGRIKEVSILILTVCNLVALLEKEGYIMTVTEATDPDKTSRFGQGVSNMPHSVSHSFPDAKISDLLVGYVDKNIVVTPEFERFCNKGFIARDEQRFTRQITVAYLAFCVALIAAFINTYNVFSKKTTTIKQNQIDTITQSLNKIGMRLDTLNKDTFYFKPAQIKVLHAKNANKRKH